MTSEKWYYTPLKLGIGLKSFNGVEPESYRTFSRWSICCITVMSTGYKALHIINSKE